jgi:serine/threonine-protein kinase
MSDQQDNRDTLDLAEWIDDVADRFEVAWKSLTPPRIEDFLDGADGDRRAVLLVELEKVDRAYRCKLALEAARSTAAGTSKPALTIPSDWPDLPGYEILEELGRGGMGVVYKAKQKALPRLAAVKMLPAGTVAMNRQHRFKAEAEAVARLQHPNIVEIYEIGNHAGRPFFVLEYVAGGSLAQRLSGQPLPARVAATLVKTLAGAVHFDHQHQIVHRDLKPANVLLVGGLQALLDSCTLKISDFGLAKELDAAEATFQTRTGEIVGTPSYMAPEQASGRHLCPGSHPLRVAHGSAALQGRIDPGYPGAGSQSRPGAAPAFAAKGVARSGDGVFEMPG